MNKIAAYHAGYAWGQKAKAESWDVDVWASGAAADSLPHFEEWLEANATQKQYAVLFEQWLKGTYHGYHGS